MAKDTPRGILIDTDRSNDVENKLHIAKLEKEKKV